MPPLDGGVIASNRRRTGGGSPALAMGLNLESANYFDNTFVTNDMRFGDNTKSQPSGNSIPAANFK